jgi:hypothetical protein
LAKLAITLLVAGVLLLVLRAGTRSERSDTTPIRGTARWLPWATLLATLSLILGFGLLWRAWFIEV